MRLHTLLQANNACGWVSQAPSDAPRRCNEWRLRRTEQHSLAERPGWADVAVCALLAPCALPRAARPHTGCCSRWRSTRRRNSASTRRRPTGNSRVRTRDRRPQSPAVATTVNAATRPAASILVCGRRPQ